MKVKFANKIYEVLYSKEVAGKTVYAVEDEPNHVDWLVNVEVIDTDEESDDEIKEEIINYFKCQSREEPLRKDIHNKWISWLENQGKAEVNKDSLNNQDEDERLRETTIAFLKEYADKGYENAVECIDWLKKQGKQKSVWHDENEEPTKGSLILIIMPSGAPVTAKVIEPNQTIGQGERWAYINDLLKK